MDKHTIETWIKGKRVEMDCFSPGIYSEQSLKRALERLPQADALELQLMIDRPLLDTEMPHEGAWACIRQTLDSGMHCDDLEVFIRDNRSALDFEAPDLRLWSAIEQALPAATQEPRLGIQRSNAWRMFTRLAASVCLLVAGVGLGIWYSGMQQAGAGMSMSEVSGEYAELERYYQTEIASKSQQLAQFVGSQPADVHIDLQQLDNIMAELKAEMANVPPGNREQVVRAMIENYKAKTSILQRVLERMEQQQNDEQTKQNLGKGIKNI